MSVEIFGRRMNDEIRAESERSLERRREERIVDDEQGPDGVRHGRDRGDVGDPQQRIARRLGPDEPRPADTSLNSTRWRGLFPVLPWPTYRATLTGMLS